MIGAGTLFEIGGIVFRYSKIAFRSESVKFEYIFQGIGGRIGRPLPRCLPLRMALMNVSSVQPPMPVALSGVRLLVKATPAGVDQAVLVSLIAVTQPGGSFGAAVILAS